MTARLYTTKPGLELRIGNYGVATYDVPVVVPRRVADELDGMTELRAERDEPTKQPGSKLSATALKAAQPKEKE